MFTDVFENVLHEKVRVLGGHRYGELLLDLAAC
jgi:hypothetical protein